ncbi:hypothetical protein PAXRUDRAFT_832323 [Paxillus rubicundulus Ve08.2h10]|uniref:Uncharacterized protein n=1 Tax=Paxillus rubicundulus Ve08.2h10 TaxID=930991 RepID=A0A0D0DD76_9AGAM|nr:hypothetical protein PAXRUDRAFT_832323 [Paxillus rubicundulus Ve08.2h10]
MTEWCDEKTGKGEHYANELAARPTTDGCKVAKGKRQRHFTYIIRRLHSSFASFLG